MSNVIMCIKCHRNYIVEEYDSHICEQLVMTVFDTNGNRWGSYDRRKFFPLPSFKITSDDNLQNDENGDNRRRLDRTTIQYL